MPFPKLLLTSFSTWKPEQCSNSSDDLLVEIHQRFPHPEILHMLRQLPVDFEEAPARVIDAIHHDQPDAVICCGMAEMRSHFCCVEERATYNGQTRQTTLNSNRLASDLRFTRVSYNAGQFVCNRLYFEVLDYLQSHPQHHCPCIFIHVPVLTNFNREGIVIDFLTILKRIHLLVDYQRTTSSPLPA